MGLGQDERNAPGRALLDWLLPLLIAGFAIAIELSGDAGRELLRYDRPGIGNGEAWRLVSGHLAHLNPSHLLLNLAGLLLIWHLVRRYLDAGSWWIVVAVSIAGIDLGLWFFEPQLYWYVGLSGVLHGLLAGGVVGGLRTRRIDVLILGTALIAKIAYEQFVGALPGSEEATGGAVVVAAHAWGALAGAVAAAIMIRVRGATSI